ncbi:hypothetical protein FACS1894199_06120 [Bacteroidia bacterium]|nr:hypothetical protein FACS1894199_06120 [Bacteroidia bacterium]
MNRSHIIPHFVTLGLALGITLCSLLLSSSAVRSQRHKGYDKGYDIGVTVKSMPNRQLLLGYYYEDKIVIADSVILDKKGVGHFKKAPDRLPKGQYFLLYNPSTIVELLIGDNQFFSIVSDTTDIIRHISFENSPENTQFIALQRFMTDIYNKEGNIIDTDSAVRVYIQRITAKFPGTALATFANFTLPVKVPDFANEVSATEFPDPKARELEIRKRGYFYYKKHFWDHTNFQDSTLIRTNLFKRRLDDYLKNMVAIHPDSLFRACDEILEKARPNLAMFKYLMNYCTKYTYEDKIMGMDEAFVKLGQKYYVSGIVNWLDSAGLKKVTDEVLKRQFNLLYHKAIDLQLTTVEGQITSLYETQAPFIFLLFWESNCAYCKKVVPQIKKDILDRFGKHGLKVFAVHTQDTKEEWQSFIEQNDLFDFINVWDPNNQSNYWTYYNVFATPVMYVLDKDKKFIAKNIAIEQMVEVLKREYKKVGINIE